jgi:hypothetical protein
VKALNASRNGANNMSAYIMNEDEINIIVGYFLKPHNSGVNGTGLWTKIGDNYDHINAENAREIGKILFDENVRSVEGRYNSNENHEYCFRFMAGAHKRPVGNIAGALDCLEYQSCESDNWHETNAWHIICDMRKELLKEIAEKDGTYTWGIE